MSKKAIITGGARRLGKAMALELASKGTDIIIHYNKANEDAEETRDLARSKGVKAEILQADLLEMTDTIQLIAKANKKMGGVFDLLINNASIFEYDNLNTVDIESWDRHINSNLRSAVFLTQKFAQQALTTQKNKEKIPYSNLNIINMIDQRVRKITPEFMSYTTAKMGLWAFTQSSAQFLAPHIRVNAIGPGPTLQGSHQSKEHFEQQRRSTPLMRGADKIDITNAMNFILNAYSLTGQLICIDSGQHLAWQTPDVLGIE